MKKLFFLLLILGFLTTNKDVSAGVEATETFEFSGYSITLTRVISNDIRGYTFQKIGANPFATTLMLDDTSIVVEDIKEINGNHVLYGFCHVLDAETYYDAFVIVLSPTGEEISRLIIDHEELETVMDVFDIDNQIFICLEQTVADIGGYYLFNGMIYQIYDYNFTFIDEVETNILPISLGQTEDLLLINIDRSTIIDYGLTSDLEFIDKEEALEIESGRIYQDEVDILFLNAAIMNSQVYYNGVSINYPGNYELLYKGFLYEFSVESSITGIEDGGVYSSSVFANVSSGNVYLNNDLYISGTEISAPGNYHLEIQGVNDFTQTYDFVITSNVSGVLHNHTYDESVDITFNGVGYLNNVHIESPYTVVQDGEYILKIQGDNNYLETYYFNIERPHEQVSLVSFIQKYDIVFLVAVVISGAIILKKK